MNLSDILPFLIAVVAVARAARLLTHDDFPPAVWLREWYVNHTSRGWEGLFLCPFCIAPYLAAGDLAWYLLSDGWVRDAWWIVNVWAALAYLAAILVTRDEPE